jgi:hypothetical protein
MLFSDIFITIPSDFLTNVSNAFILSYFRPLTASLISVLADPYKNLSPCLILLRFICFRYLQYQGQTWCRPPTPTPSPSFLPIGHGSTEISLKFVVCRQATGPHYRTLLKKSYSFCLTCLDISVLGRNCF